MLAFIAGQMVTPVFVFLFVFVIVFIAPQSSPHEYSKGGLTNSNRYLSAGKIVEGVTFVFVFLFVNICKGCLYLYL